MFNILPSVSSKSWCFLKCAPRLTNVRYSRYSPNFIEPVVDKEEQKRIRERGELNNYLLRPIKAARSNETCSIFYDPLVAKFTNYFLEDGKKMVAKRVIEKTFEQVKRNQVEKFNKATTDEERNSIILDPLVIFKQAVKNATPIMKLIKIKRGGLTYQVPYPITENEKHFRAMKWLIESGNDKKQCKHFPEKMAYELIDAAENKGFAVKKKTELHRQCEANRAYAHYRWN